MRRSNMCNIHTEKKTERTQEEITISGNPAKPQGEDGATMLKRMNESHSPVTCWGAGALADCTGRGASGHWLRWWCYVKTDG